MEEKIATSQTINLSQDEIVMGFVALCIENCAEKEGVSPRTMYHGSVTIVKSPLCNVGRDDLDFGKGFYLTDIYEQAQHKPNNQICILNQEIVDKYLTFKKSEIVTI